MFWAINKKTNERLNAMFLLDNPKYQFISEEEWIADWDEIINADKIKEKYNEIKVIFVNEKTTINFKGTKFKTSPHFRIPNASKLGINIIPESPEHIMAKNWIYNLLSNQKINIKLYYSTVNKPFRYINAVNLKDLPIDKSKISIETNERDITTKRIDVICPFLSTHSLFGNGINFEIQFSRQRKNTKEKRTFEAAFSGYSICWIGYSEFEKLNDKIIILKDNILKINSFGAIINYSNKQHIKNLKYTVQEETRKIDGFIYEIKTNLKEELNNLIKDNIKQFKENLSINQKDALELNEKIDSALFHIKTFNEEKQVHCPKCNAKLIYKEGISKIGNPYKIWSCPICEFHKFIN